MVYQKLKTHEQFVLGSHELHIYDDPVLQTVREWDKFGKWRNNNI